MAGDLPAIVALLANDKLGQAREDASLPLNSKYVEAFTAIEADPNQLLAVVEQNGAVVGCLQITYVPGLTRLGMWRGQIEGVRIAEALRGDGMGEQMMQWAIQQCILRGCEMVQLTTDLQRPEAHRFYEKLGFVGSHLGMKLAL